MSTHTPGPWEIESGHIQNGGIAYWQITDGADAICCNQFCYADNSDANARLIVAAPELLDEARKQVTWLRHLRTEAVGSLRGSLIDGIDQSIKYLSAAIAKAEGRS